MKSILRASRFGHRCRFQTISHLYIYIVVYVSDESNTLDICSNKVIFLLLPSRFRVACNWFLFYAMCTRVEFLFVSSGSTSMTYLSAYLFCGTVIFIKCSNFSPSHDQHHDDHQRTRFLGVVMSSDRHDLVQLHKYLRNSVILWLKINLNKNE